MWIRLCMIRMSATTFWALRTAVLHPKNGERSLATRYLLVLVYHDSVLAMQAYRPGGVVIFGSQV